MKIFFTAHCLIALLALSRSADAVEDKYSITPKEHAACDADAARLCYYTYPDEDLLFNCMKQKRKELAPACLTVLQAGARRRHLQI